MSLFGNDLDESNDDYALEYASLNSVDCLVLLVDASPSMREVFRELIRVVVEIFAKKIKFPRDRIGVVFYNTGSSSNPLQFNHIYVWRGLEGITAESIADLQNIASQQEKFDDFCQLLDGQGPVDEPADFSQVIWTVIMLFGTVKLKSVDRRVFILSNNDDPSNGDRSLRSKAQKKLADLCEMDTLISVLPVRSPQNVPTQFSFSKFYGQFIDEESENLDRQFVDTKRPQDLSLRIALSTNPRRVLASTQLTLDKHGELTMAIDVFSLRMEAKIPNPVYIDPESNEPLTTQSNWIAQDTGELLDDLQVTSYHSYGGKNITLSKDDIKKMKSIYPSGLQLLGFKPLSQLADYHNIKPAVFLRPNEKRITGSSLLMQALIERTNAKDVFVVARMNLRDNQVPRIVALLPQQQQVNDFGDVVVPAGFNCITLPYADDLRQIPDVIACEMPGMELIDKAIAICKGFQIEQYTPQMYDNPHLARFSAALKALALNQPEQEHAEDTLTVGEPKASKLLFDDFANSAFPNGPPDVSDGAIGKRSSKASKEASESNKKRSKAPANSENLSVDQLYAKNMLGTLTVQQLKAYLQEYGLPHSGNKAALIDRVSNHISLK